MAGNNQTFLFGNLTRDPETRQVNGKAITKIGLAVNNPYNKEKPLYIDVEFWERKADLVAEFAKGDRIIVTGELATDSWDDKTTGEKRSRIVLKGQDFAYPERRAEVSEPPPARERPTSTPKPKGRPAPPPADDDDDIPF